MLERMGSFARSNAVGLIALFVALGGTSYAATRGFADGQGRLNGCVGAHGALRLIKPHRRCAKGEKPVSWNVQGRGGRPGAAGANGAAGAPGQNGAPGQPGPSDAYTGTKPGYDITLPPGSYEVFAKETIDNPSSQTGNFDCQVEDSGFTTQYDAANQSVPAVNGTVSGRATVNLVAAVELPSTTTLTLTCQSTLTDPNLKFLYRQLTAIKVGTLHTQ